MRDYMVLRMIRRKYLFMNVICYQASEIVADEGDGDEGDGKAIGPVTVVMVENGGNGCVFGRKGSGNYMKD